MSHPSWVCGLKLLQRYPGYRGSSVTPFVGVWIETAWGLHPGREGRVTPFVGVWIETRPRGSFHFPSCVTPFVGVWIETLSAYSVKIDTKGHTLRGCVD